MSTAVFLSSHSKPQPFQAVSCLFGDMGNAQAEILTFATYPIISAQFFEHGGRLFQPFAVLHDGISMRHGFVKNRFRGFTGAVDRERCGHGRRRNIGRIPVAQDVEAEEATKFMHTGGCSVGFSVRRISGNMRYRWLIQYHYLVEAPLLNPEFPPPELNQVEFGQAGLP